jgi:RimJ/RimL family protein N-acetyltransferase
MSTSGVYFPKTLDENRFFLAWIGKRIPYASFGDSQCIAVYRSDKIAAVICYTNYRKVDIEMSFASDNPRWATRQMIAVLLSFPFVQLKVQRVTSMILKSNKRARKLIVGAGFVEEGAHRHAGPNKELMLSYGMTRDDFLKRYGSMKIQKEVMQSGQKVAASATAGT